MPASVTLFLELRCQSTAGDSAAATAVATACCFSSYSTHAALHQSSETGFLATAACGLAVHDEVSWLVSVTRRRTHQAQMLFVGECVSHFSKSSSSIEPPQCVHDDRCRICRRVSCSMLLGNKPHQPDTLVFWMANGSELCCCQ